MKKKIATALVLACLAAIAVAIILYLSLGRIVKTGIEKVGSTVTKCPVTVENITFRPLQGTLRITDFVLGNPDGYKAASAFSVDEISIAMEPKSVFSDRIVVTEVTIHAPQITYEVGMLETNIGVIKKNVEAFIAALEKDGTDDVGKAPEEADETPGAGKTVEISHFLVDGGHINITTKISPGGTASLPLPRLELTDLGKGADGQSIPKMVAEVFDEILGSTLGVVKQSGVLVGNAAKQLGTAGKNAATDTTKGVGRALQGVKGLFK